jgi:leucyl-tRNA synthetase
VTPAEVKIDGAEGGARTATLATTGEPITIGGIEKMSKSKNNVVEPRDIIRKFGADTARLFTMFAAPPDQSATWSDSGAEGAYRYLRRLWSFAVKNADRVHSAGANPAGASGAAKELRREVHLLLRQISHDYERLQYNTVVSGAMKLLNALEGAKLGDGATPADAAVLREGLGILLRALYPAAPHITHVLWAELGYVKQHGDLLDTPWPQVDEAALQQSEIELMLQVNGKLRGSIRVPANAGKHTIEHAALHSPDFIKFAEGKRAKKVIVVPGRLVNVVV